MQASLLCVHPLFSPCSLIGHGGEVKRSRAHPQWRAEAQAVHSEYSSVERVRLRVWQHSLSANAFACACALGNDGSSDRSITPALLSLDSAPCVSADAGIPWR